MEGFGNIFKAELFKLVKGKALLKLVIALVIIITVFTVLFNFLYEIAGDMLNAATTSSSEEVTEEMVEAARLSYEQVVKQNESLNVAKRVMNTNVYQAKIAYNLSKYMYENHVSPTSVTLFGTISNLTANSYMTFMMDILITVFAIFGIVIMIKSFAGERNNGTLKMQLLRPISKDAVLVGKFLATWVVTVGFMILSFAIISVIGVLIFKFDTSKVLGIVNGEKIFLMSPYAAMILTLVYNITYVSQFIMIGLFASVLLRKNEGGAIAIGIVMLLIGANIEEWLGYALIGYVGITQNASWLRALTITGPALNYMSIYSMVGISIAWFVGMFLASLYIFRKDDIHN